MLLHFAQKFPAAGADVALLNGSPMHGHRRRAQGKRPVENLEEPIAAGGRVVHAAPHFHRHRNVRRHDVACPLYDFQRHLRLSQMKSAAAFAKHLLHRAAEVDVNHVEARLDQPRRPGRELLRLGPHQLPADGMLLVARIEAMPRPGPLLQAHQELIQHHLANCIRRPQPASNHPHRPIAIAGQGRLHDGEIELYVSELNRRILNLHPHLNLDLKRRRNSARPIFHDTTLAPIHRAARQTPRPTSTRESSLEHRPSPCVVLWRFPMRVSIQ